ncbi:hypothetical protein [Methanobrevibacter sp.]
MDKMECRMCGHEIDTENVKDPCLPHQCSGCKNCHKVICPKCGYANDLAYDNEFQFIINLKSKIRAMRSSK